MASIKMAAVEIFLFSLSRGESSSREKSRGHHRASWNSSGKTTGISCLREGISFERNDVASKESDDVFRPGKATLGNFQILQWESPAKEAVGNS